MNRNVLNNYINNFYTYCTSLLQGAYGLSCQILNFNSLLHIQAFAADTRALAIAHTSLRDVKTLGCDAPMMVGIKAITTQKMVKGRSKR